jgi:hypothetical protein
VSETKKASKAKVAKSVEGEPIITKEQAKEFVQKYEKMVKEVKLKEAKEEAPNGVITAPNKPGTGGKKKSSTQKTFNGAIGSAGAERKDHPPVQSEKSTVEKVAIHSTRNVSWIGVGRVLKGYNIVSKESADKWLTRDHVRIATPEEVASEYNK